MSVCVCVCVCVGFRLEELGSVVEWFSRTSPCRRRLGHVGRRSSERPCRRRRRSAGHQLPVGGRLRRTGRRPLRPRPHRCRRRAPAHPAPPPPAGCRPLPRPPETPPGRPLRSEDQARGPDGRPGSTVCARRLPEDRCAAAQVISSPVPLLRAKHSSAARRPDCASTRYGHDRRRPRLTTYYTQGEVMSQNLWSPYDRHFVGKRRLMCGFKGAKIYIIVLFRCKLHHFGLRKCLHFHQLTNKAYLSITVA